MKKGTGSTGIPGVREHASGLFHAYIYIDGRQYSLGYSETKKGARELREAAERRLKAGWLPAVHPRGRRASEART